MKLLRSAQRQTRNATDVHEVPAGACIYIYMNYAASMYDTCIMTNGICIDLYYGIPVVACPCSIVPDFMYVFGSLGRERGTPWQMKRKFWRLN